MHCSKINIRPEELHTVTGYIVGQSCSTSSISSKNFIVFFSRTVSVGRRIMMFFCWNCSCVQESLRLAPLSTYPCVFLLLALRVSCVKLWLDTELGEMSRLGWWWQSTTSSWCMGCWRRFLLTFDFDVLRTGRSIPDPFLSRRYYLSLRRLPGLSFRLWLA